MDGFKEIGQKMLFNWFILLQGNRYTLTQLFNTNLNAIEKLTI